MHEFAVANVKPDLGLVAVIFVGYLFGELEGMVVGGLLGLTMDIFSGGVLGTNLLVKMAVGGLSGLVGRIFLELRPGLVMGMFFILSFAMGCLTYLIITLGAAHVGFGRALLWIILPQALYDSIAGMICLLLIPYRARMRHGIA